MKRVLLALCLVFTSSQAVAASESATVERLYSEWRFAEADRALAALSKAHPAEPGTLLACLRCRQTNPVGSRFCSACGAAL